MIKSLIYKELKLVVNPTTYFFTLLSALLLIPSYPYFVGISYAVFGMYTTFNLARANKDHEFSAALPIPRNYIVLGKLITVVYSELLQLIIAVPFAVLSSLVINKNGNPVGMDANLAFFGLSFIAYGLFNITFLPMYFKTGYKTTIPLIVGTLIFALFIIICELLINFIPALKISIDGLDSAYIGIRGAVLAVGVVLFIVISYLSYKLSAKTFEKVNL